MKKAGWISPLLPALTLVATFSTGDAWAKQCGGIGATKVTCACGDTVVRNTVLDQTDPVTKGNCPPPIALSVQGEPVFMPGPTLDASLLNPRGGLCASDNITITAGIEIIGDKITVIGGIIRGCDVGIIGLTNGSTIEHVAVRDASGVGLLLTGNSNMLLGNSCFDSGLGGILMIGNGNLLQKNYCVRSGGDGIDVRGISNTLNSNQSHHNADSGIDASGPNFSNGKNYAVGNGGPFQCLIDGNSGIRC